MKKTVAEAEQNTALDAAREKLTAIFDEDSFTELGRYVASGDREAAVVCGYATMDGIPVYAFAQDSNVCGGAMDAASAMKLKKLYELARKNGAPIVGIYDSKGADITEGMKVLGAYGEIAALSAELSGVVPQIALIDGICAGTAAMIACMADIVIMTEKSELFMTAPFVSGQKDTGTANAAANAGTAAVVVKDTEQAAKTIKQLIALLPKNNLEPADYFYESAESDAVITSDTKGIELINALADKGSAAELYKGYGENVVTALASLNCRTVGIVCADGGKRLSARDCAKTARFAGFCDAFSIPLITFIDTEGFAQSGQEELAGAVLDNAKLAQIYASATTPKVTVVTGKAYGSAYAALAGVGSDFCIAWEDAVISPASPEAVTAFINGAADKDTAAKMAAQYAEDEADPFTAAKLGYVDRVILPEDTRAAVISAVEAAADKRVAAPARKHINFVF